MQTVRVVAVTKEIEDYNPEEVDKELTILSGKAAGVCYMPDNYLSDGIQNSEKALKRAEGNTKSGHHSVYDHGHISMVMETSKMMCIILNSLGVYATSEKSSRYVKMHPETELEINNYNKWTNKIQELILKKYPTIDDTELNKRLHKKLAIENTNKLVVSGELQDTSNPDTITVFNEIKKSDTLPSRKLGIENARYMISVFTPTVMEYTVSFRQLFLIIDYLDKLSINIDYMRENIEDYVDTKENQNKAVNFINRIQDTSVELNTELKKLVKTNRITDIKNQYIRVLEEQHVADCINLPNNERKYNAIQVVKDKKPRQQVIGDSYTLVYKNSFAMFAQEERHRTIRHMFSLLYAGQYGFYTPEIIKDFGLESEWQSDIKSIEYCIPQGTLIRITEQGIFEDFVLKCKERLCGRAQLETMKRNTESMQLFIDNKDKLCTSNQLLLESVTQNNAPCARCLFGDFNCVEGCQWGPDKALTRLV